MRGLILRALLGSSVVASALVVAAPLPAAPPGDRYAVTPLVSDVSGATASTDSNLVNGWGLARNGPSPWWVSDNEPGKASVYDVSSTPTTVRSLAPVVDGGPTGAVFAGIANNFLVGTTPPPTVVPASFIFPSKD